MVYMSNAEVERRQKDDLGGRDFGENVDRNDDGAEDHLFCDGAGDIIAIALPAAEALEDRGDALYMSFDDDEFEKWTEVE
jgi:hypothetical protein